VEKLGHLLRSDIKKAFTEIESKGETENPNTARMAGKNGLRKEEVPTDSYKSRKALGFIANPGWKERTRSSPSTVGKPRSIKGRLKGNKQGRGKNSLTYIMHRAKGPDNKHEGLP